SELEQGRRCPDGGDDEGADENEGSGGAPKDHLRHPAPCRRAAVLRLPLLRRGHRLVAAVREELCAELQLRLRKSVRGALARSLGADLAQIRPEAAPGRERLARDRLDRKSTRLNSSHDQISY